VRPRVKICGLTRAEDAVAAVRAGADALGFVFWPESPRAVSPDTARAIGRQVPALVTRVGVFVNTPPDEVKAIVRHAGLDAVQLHGDEAVEDYLTLGVRLIKAVSGGQPDAQAWVRRCPEVVTILIDAFDRNRRGGTGRRADWTLAAAIARDRPIVLAGGLTAATVADAIRQVRPWGLDVSSGVERAPGIKDPDRLATFFAQVSAADVEEP
jgi:phosphoribosylanthranilate isomerase